MNRGRKYILNNKFSLFRASKISIELLITFFYAVFIVCFAAAILSAVFLQFSFTLIFLLYAPLFALIAALPGLTLFGLPAALIADAFGIKKRGHWIMMGIFVSMPSYYLIANMFEENNFLFFMIGLAIGAVTGSKLHHRLYIIEGKS